MNRTSKSFLGVAAAIFTLLPSSTAYAQLSLAPTFVYIDSPDRFGSLVVTNGSSITQEVSVGFSFGYPSADSLGTRFIQYGDSAAAGAHELSPWIRSFPERFRIEPGRRQVIRMMVQPSTDLEDGIYWTRMTVTSREEPTPHSEGVGARVDFNVKQVISVVYRKGNSATGAQIAGLRTTRTNTGMGIQAVFKRTGEVPFFGTAVCRLLDDSGRSVREIETSTEVYFSASTLFRIEDVAAGTYAVEIELRPLRTDVPRGRLPHMEMVTRRFALEIPEASTEVAHVK